MLFCTSDVYESVCGLNDALLQSIASVLALMGFFVSVLCRICGCGSGESGCSSCGCCKACARELDGQEARQRGIFDAVKEMIPLDLLLGIEVSSITFTTVP